MVRTPESLARTSLLALVCYSSVLAQAPPVSTLVVDLDNVVEYQCDIIYDPSRFAKDPNIATGKGEGNFGVVTLIGDIVAVNGRPAKGLYVGRTRAVHTTTAPNPSQAIADLTRTAMREQIFEILQSDGTPIGTIMA